MRIFVGENVFVRLKRRTKYASNLLNTSGKELEGKRDP
jgi:hypothetical protein